MDENQNDGPEIKLDGSMGPGNIAVVTLTTKDEYGEKTTSYEFPYALINHEMLTKMMTYRFILGSSILVKQEEQKRSEF